MAKKNPKPAEERDASSYYRLNTKAVDDLVEASPENSPPVSEAELRQYRHGPKLKRVHLGEGLKAFLIKWWFAGMVCYFFVTGLSGYIGSTLDQLVIVSVALALVTDLLTNGIFRAYARQKGANDRWMMFPRNTIGSLLLYVVYSFVLMLFIYTTYLAVNMAWAALVEDENALLLGVGPIGFGIIAAGWDLLFVGLKNAIRSRIPLRRQGPGVRD